MSLPRRPLAVVFDLDGTLIDSETLVRDAYFAASAHFGAAITEAQFLALVGMHREANDAILRSYWGADFPLERFYEVTRAHIGGRTAPLKPGARELLDALDETGTPFGLATSSGRPWVERHFTAHQLSERFRAVITRDDCVNGKPDPEPYLRASAALRAAPAEVAALEDSHAGVRAAYAAGCMTIMIPDLLAADPEMRAKARIAASLFDAAALLGVRASCAPSAADM